MVHGKATRLRSVTYSRKPRSASPFSHHFPANVSMASKSRSPLWEQLSMLTMAMGFLPARNRRYRSPATCPI